MLSFATPMREFARRLSLGFQDAVGTSVEQDPGSIMRTIKNALAYSGVVVFGETHGVYSHADFVTAFMPHAKEAGADRLYVEMFHERNQKYIDAWQDGGDASGIIWLMNNSPSYSDLMWTYYWNVLQAAKENGLRIVTIQPDRLHSVWPGMEIFYRNLRFENAIRADQRRKDAERPFILYSGEWHLDRMQCAKGSPMHKLLDGAGIRIINGDYRLIRPMQKDGVAHMCVPRVPGQPPITFRPIRREARIACTPH